MWAGRVLGAIPLPGDLPVRLDFHLDGRVLAYTAAVTAAGALFVSLLPALRASRGHFEQTLRAGQGSRTTAARHQVRTALVVTQIAVCFVLLVAAGLFTRSLAHAERADLGFRAEGILNIQMDVAQLGYAEPRGSAVFEEIERRVRAIPGVEDLSFAFTVPMGYVRVGAPLDVEGHPVPTADRPLAGKNIVGPRYFTTLGMPIVRGRSFTDADDRRARPVAIVNQHLADLLWSGQDPLGRRFSEVGPSGPWTEVVGVAATGKYLRLFEEPQPYYYVPMAQEYAALRVLHVRTSLTPEALAPLIERQIHEQAPALPLYDVQSMTRALGSAFGFFPVRTAAMFSVAFGLLGLVLAAIGLYGVVSGATVERTQEIGVRMALGATAHNVLWLIIREAMILASVGIVLGLIGARVVTKAGSSLLYGVEPTDPVSLAVAAAVLFVMTIVASYIPARRAVGIDPMAALRHE